MSPQSNLRPECMTAPICSIIFWQSFADFARVSPDTLNSKETINKFPRCVEKFTGDSSSNKIWSVGLLRSGSVVMVMMKMIHL